MSRPRNERDTSVKVFLAYDGDWHGFKTVGTKPDGTPDRRHRRGPTEDAVREKLRELEDQIATGTVPKVGRVPTLEKWLWHWYENIAPIRAGESTLVGYETHIRIHLIPRLGGWSLNALSTEHVDTMIRALQKEGLSDQTIVHIHSTLRRALNKAKSRGYCTTNAAVGAEVPTVDRTELEPLTTDEALRVLKVAQEDERSFAMWLVYLLGLRQSEVLGLRWSDIDLDAGILQVQAKAKRRKLRHGCKDPAACAAKHCITAACVGPWEHGCDDPRECAKPHCRRYQTAAGKQKYKPCSPGCTKHGRGCPQRRRGKCRRHRAACPEPCQPGCTGHARLCPEREGGLVLIVPETTAQEAAAPDDGPRRRGSRRPTKRVKKIVTKSVAGTRRVGIPDVILHYLKRHRAVQEAEKERAGTKWEGKDLVFCTELGRQIDPSRNWAEWADMLEIADVEHIPLHGNRHTAATMLLAVGVSRRVVMDIFGWSDERMLMRYQHVADDLRTSAAEKLRASLWPSFATDLATRAVEDGS